MKKTLDSNTLQTALTLLSVEYMKECLGASETGARKAEKELVRLKAAGLSRCTNARILSSMTSDSSGSTRRLACEIKQAYPKALIVPYIDLFRVMKEYNLSVGLIEHYTKIIPEENIAQICEASEALDHLELNHMRYIHKIKIDSDMPKSAVRLISSYVARFPLMGISNWGKANPLLPDVREATTKYNNSIAISHRGLEHREWLIAAPVADLPENTTIEYFSGRAEERRRIAEDPIVFKASSVGAIIVSMWGEEANSSIFDKYR